MTNLNYRMSNTGQKFHKSRARVKGILGPVGSGKSVSMCWEIWLRANAQRVSPDGYRRSRWAIVRNTFWELENTTMKTWMDWFGPDKIPEPIGKYVGKPNYSHKINIPPVKDSQGNIIRPGLMLEAIFVAMDRPEDAKKLGSLELTGAWINEARELPFEIVTGINRRCGRYPSKKDGGSEYPGVIMDTNPPDDSHWWYKMAEEDMWRWDETNQEYIPLENYPAYKRWDFFHQPSGLSPEAENLENLDGGQQYYLSMIPGMTEEEVNVYVHGKYGVINVGEPVYGKAFNDNLHVSKTNLEAVENRTIIVGIDYGLTPAAVFAQKHESGQWRILNEITTHNMAADEFSVLLKQYIHEKFPKHTLEQFEFYGDPSVKRSEVDKSVVTDAFLRVGIIVRPSPCHNVWDTRKRCVLAPLNRMIMGQPGLLLSPACQQIRKGFNGGYHYKKVKISGGGYRYLEQAEKNEYSHVHDALQYTLAGGGESLLLRTNIPGGFTQTHKAKMNWSPYGRSNRTNR